MKNSYEIKGDVVEVHLNNDQKTLISIDDLEKVKEFPNKWLANWSKRRGVYIVVGNLPWNGKGKRKRILLSRWIMDPPNNMVVDHINHNTLDNSRENLRILTYQQNSHNRKGPNSNNSSGIRGVTRTSNGKWMAYLGFNWEVVRVGIYDTKEEARKAVKNKRKKLIPSLSKKYQESE